jgi:hypothetical protein
MLERGPEGLPPERQCLAAERLTEKLQTCGKEIYAGTGGLIGTVDGFTVEQALPGWFSEPEEGWNEKEI